ncbi:aspartate/glutamate racemase family protein [Microbacterium esteraromaticum]|uniref:Aspartate/glutamate racemase family protein n=1 Tax=Microbacterium esteraromaticum TaxID=57043 RepID=A0A7D8ABA4_9MICO|nr:aspartate/glutamate racemase family protein [Microbacterium esteraromaticum]QMU97241.1 aspartate/glutamate racemase family protein [Microbacterium esteraromaticum]
MKTIGVLGGMSWESSLEWYRLANQRVRDALGGHHSARIIIDSLDFAEIEELQSRGDWDAAGSLLAERARGLEGAGADLIVLCTNTMHLVADRIEGATEVPFLHIADTTAAAVLNAGVRRVGLLGTAFTMEQPFYRERLEAHGIEVLVPNAEQRAGVHAVIYDELVHGVIRPESRAYYREVIDVLAARGAEGVILGCTEIELLITAADSPVPVFPTTALHVDAALAAAGVARAPAAG